MSNHPRIYPAIDIINGQCVRLTKGDYNTVKIYDTNPLDVAKQFEEAGASFIHIVDLDAARNPENNNRALISSIIKQTALKVQTGGGIRKKDDVVELLNVGAERLIIGSVAVSNREIVYDWIAQYGAASIVIGADVKGQHVATHGWFNVSDESIFDFIKSYSDHGATTFLCTDIAKDGMLEGSSVDLYKDLLQHMPEINLIASGGVSDITEVNKLIALGIESIIIGKAIYEGKITLSDLFQKN